MEEESGRFLIFPIDFMAFYSRFSKYSLGVASSMVSIVVLFVFETSIILKSSFLIAWNWDYSK